MKPARFCPVDHAQRWTCCLDCLIGLLESGGLKRVTVLSQLRAQKTRLDAEAAKPTTGVKG